jgi:RNA polymerase sigma-70 factor (ECF subfamily)
VVEAGLAPHRQAALPRRQPLARQTKEIVPLRPLRREVDESALALEQLYLRRYAAFRRAVAAIVGSEEVARDVVQETFARALRNRKSFRGDGSLEGWVWRIAVRTALEMRRNGREVGLEDALARAGLPKPERDPALAEAIRRLPPRRRLIVFLRYFADLSYAAIAEAIGVAEGTVAASLAQARHELETALQQGEREE